MSDHIHRQIIHIAIVEDDEKDSRKLEECLVLYKQESANIDYEIEYFREPITFLSTYTQRFDLIFLDIEMAGMNGMQAARDIRRIDEAVVIVFITNMAQYAVEGYSVDALDYIIKPVSYEVFVLKMHRILRFVSSVRDEYVVIMYERRQQRILVDAIEYIEVQRHHLWIYMSDRNDPICLGGTMQDIENKLLFTKQFCRPNVSFLVNMKCIQGFNKDFCYIGKKKITISRQRKKEFMQALMEYLRHGRGLQV